MPDPLPPRGTLIAFDFGLSRIGVAIGETETGIASPLETLQAETNQQRFLAIETLLQEWQPAAAVVGIPRHLDGTPHEMTQRCARFANQLRGRFGLAVIEWDERLSSQEAARALRTSQQSHGRQHKGRIDAVAATIILQHYLESQHHV